MDIYTKINNSFYEWAHKNNVDLPAGTDRMLEHWKKDIANHTESAVENAQAELAALFINAAGGKVILTIEVLSNASFNPKIHREILPDKSVEYWLDETEGA